jgi:hypothetical protein
MDRKTRFLFAAFVVIPLITAQANFEESGSFQPELSSTRVAILNGRWQVKFAYTGLEKNLMLDAKAKGSGTFLLMDTGPNNEKVPNPFSAAWAQLTNDRVSFSGEAELPIGTCCREKGTLIFKGRFRSPDEISGKLIFVTSVDEEESPYNFHSVTGTFVARRVLN